MLEKREATISPAGEPRIKERQLAAEEQMRDIVAYLYFGVRHYSRERLGAASKAVLRQIGWVIMPMVCMLSCTQPCEADLRWIVIEYWSTYLAMHCESRDLVITCRATVLRPSTPCITTPIYVDRCHPRHRKTRNFDVGAASVLVYRYMNVLSGVYYTKIWRGRTT